MVQPSTQITVLIFPSHTKIILINAIEQLSPGGWLKNFSTHSLCTSWSMIFWNCQIDQVKMVFVYIKLKIQIFVLKENRGNPTYYTAKLWLHNKTVFFVPLFLSSWKDKIFLFQLKEDEHVKKIIGALSDCMVFSSKAFLSFKHIKSASSLTYGWRINITGKKKL